MTFLNFLMELGFSCIMLQLNLSCFCYSRQTAPQPLLTLDRAPGVETTQPLGPLNVVCHSLALLSTILLTRVPISSQRRSRVDFPSLGRRRTLMLFLLILNRLRPGSGLEAFQMHEVSQIGAVYYFHSVYTCYSPCI